MKTAIVTTAISLLYVIPVLLLFRGWLYTRSVPYLVGAAALLVAAMVTSILLRRLAQRRIQGMRDAYRKLSQDGTLREFVASHPELAEGLATLNSEEFNELISGLPPEDVAWLRQEVDKHKAGSTE